MKTMALLGGIAAAVVSISLGEAEPLKYLGRQGEAPTGWIEFGHEQYYEIGAGTSEIRRMLIGRELFAATT